MANRSSVHRQKKEISSQARSASFQSLEGILDALPAANVAPANDNPELNGMPACLAVTDAEVRLLRQYLGPEILGLFS